MKAHRITTGKGEAESRLCATAGRDDPDDNELADPDTEVRKDLQRQIEGTQNYKRALGNGEAAEEAMGGALSARRRIVCETPGFSTVDVMRDSFKLMKITRRLASTAHVMKDDLPSGKCASEG